MNNLQADKLNAEVQLQSIDLIKHYLNSSTYPPKTENDYKFGIDIVCHADPENSRIIILVNIEIRSKEDEQMTLGSLSVNCFFKIVNFDEIVKIAEDGIADMPPLLINTLNSISISTVRGIAYSLFRGTFLHKAVIPIIDPNQLKPTKSEAN